jgi:hypothetical protein
MLVTPGTRSRVHREDPACDEVVKEPPDGGEVLLHRRLRTGVVLDIAGDDNRVDVLKPEPSPLTPFEELIHRSGIRQPRIRGSGSNDRKMCG